jgi:rhodanese-related sulfurtransferase
MKFLLLVFSLCVSTAFAADIAKLTPADAAKLVADGKAVLVDVREANEWAETGVAAPAVLLAKSEFDAGMIGEWKHFLSGVGDKQVILYCRSGHRAGVVGAVLAEQGYKVANAGGMKDWLAAGLPVRKAGEPRK